MVTHQFFVLAWFPIKEDSERRHTFTSGVIGLFKVLLEREHGKLNGKIIFWSESLLPNKNTPWLALLIPLGNPERQTRRMLQTYLV